MVRARLAVLVSLCLPIGGMVLAQSLPPVTGQAAPAVVKAEAPRVPASVGDGLGAVVDTKTYVIGPEDIINIKVWREADLSGPVAVRPDGKVTMPLIGDLQAEGLTPDRLGVQIKEALSEYYNSPDVTVSLYQVNSNKYFISGEVNRSGQFPLVVPTRVFDALSNAGGFRDFANKKKVVIVRGAQRIKFNYEEVLKGKKLEQNIFLENGDTIIVP